MSHAQTPNTEPRNGSTAGAEAANARRHFSQAERQRSENQMRASEAAVERAAEAGHDATRAGREILQRNMETAQDAVRAGLGTGAQILESMTQMVSNAFGMGAPNPELAEQSSRDIRAVSDASAALARGTQEACRIWFDLVQRGVCGNFEASTELAACRSPQDLMALQSKVTRDNLARYIESGQQIAQCSTAAIGEANSAIRSVTRQAA